MKSIINYLIICVIITMTTQVNAQITIGTATIPDIGDRLTYTSFVGLSDTSGYKLAGENLIWNFENFTTGPEELESYLDINQTDLVDEFPDANMVLSIFNFQAAAVRSDSAIYVLGLESQDFTGFGVETEANFDQPYLYRTVPLTFGDQFSDAFDVAATFPSNIIPGLDSIDIPIPGTTLDSLRITLTISKTETVTAWGTLNLLGESFEVLKIRQIDSTSTKIEAGLRSVFGFTWVDATPLIGDDIGINQNSVTYKFVTDNSKRSIIEISENVIQDTIVVVSGRITNALFSNTVNITNDSKPLHIYPNPSSDFIQVGVEDEVNMLEKLILVDSKGRIIQERNNYVQSDRIPVHQMLSGTYIIISFVGNDIYTAKFLKE